MRGGSGWRHRCDDRAAGGSSRRHRTGGRLGNLRRPRRRGHRDEAISDGRQPQRRRNRSGRAIGASKESVMQLGMIGLGRMGANMVRRLLRGGHQCVVFDRSRKTVEELTQEKALGAYSLADFVKKLEPPRAVWLMVPAAAVDTTIADLLPFLEKGDILIDGGNSYYIDDIRRAKELAAKGIHYVDVGTSGGVWGKERGYCQMIGGDTEVVERLDPIFAALAPAFDAAPRTLGRSGPPTRAEHGYLRCGPVGAGHFVKMVH